MNTQRKRIDLFSFIQKVHYYSYFETLLLTFTYLCVGYLLNPSDICIMGGEFSYILILLSIITLFHGFENGMLGVGIVAFAMWYFYATFPYMQFLTILMMILILSEFHYYWSKKIREASTDSEYKNIKLNELSRAFYSLKISHDQLEKNYVTKPMSLRNSMMSIKEMQGDREEKFNAFFKLLEKSFNITTGAIVYKHSNGKFAVIAKSSDAFGEFDLQDQLINKAIDMKKPTYVSNEEIRQSRYIAVIPAMQEDEIVGLLLIEKIPFMSFNRENLTSISIILEYFFHQNRKQNFLVKENRLHVITDQEFRYAYFRLYGFFNTNSVDSTVLVLKLCDELLALRLYELIQRRMRALDRVTFIEQENLFTISVLFPLAHKSVALGFLNTLYRSMPDLKEDQFEYMLFGFDKIDLYNRYISASNG